MKRIKKFIKRMKDRKLLLLSILHWMRMMDYAEAHLTDGIDGDKMGEEIGERWGAEDCPLCQAYEKTCELCPLNRKCIDYTWHYSAIVRAEAGEKSYMLWMEHAISITNYLFYLLIKNKLGGKLC